MPIFNAGDKTIFQQTNAPTGWTKDITNYNNYCLRVVSGAASFGGSVDFTSVFTTTPWTGVPFPMPNLGSTTLTAPQLPVHTHAYNNPSVQTINNTPAIPYLQLAPAPPRVVAAISPSTTNNSGAASPAFGSGGHDHPLSVTVSGDCGDLSVNYVDVIICSKD